MVITVIGCLQPVLGIKGSLGAHVFGLCHLVEPVAVLCWQVLELQQQLKSVQHQLRVEEARTGQSVLLERDSRDLSDTLSALRAKQQEEQITRSHKPPTSHRLPAGCSVGIQPCALWLGAEAAPP